jgi:hypothetical protein
MKMRVILGNGPTNNDNDTIKIYPNNKKYSTHLYKIHNLKPESINSVTTEFVLQTVKHLRYYIKELDYLLKTGGTFEILLVDSQSHSRYFRSREQVKYEFSIATNGRYKMISSESTAGVLCLTYVKCDNTLVMTDSINNWSFGIISNGKKNSWVLDLIKSIEDQNIPKYEIIICGPSPYDGDRKLVAKNTIIINDVLLEDDIRAPITHKKNAIIRKAQFNNLCIMHDRYLLPKTWFKAFCEYGNYFDALCLRTQNQDGNRFGVDWMKFHYPLADRFKLNRPLEYGEWHEEAIIPGGVILLKKNLIESILLDERLFWDEMEDIQLSKNAYINGLLISVDPLNYFISREVRHSVSSYSWYRLHIYEKYLWLRSILANYLKYWRIVKQYYNTQKA